MAASEVKGSEPIASQNPSPVTGKLGSRQFLSLERLTINDLPPHTELPALPQGERTSLAQFLNSLFAEAVKVDFNDGWTHRGTWYPEGKHVAMPQMPVTNITTDTNVTQAPVNGSQTTKNVLVEVRQHIKTMQDKQTWLARTSFHDPSDVEYSELDKYISQEHSLNEGRYTPSVYDANELLAWTAQDLQTVVSGLNPDFNVEAVQMSSKLYHHSDHHQYHTSLPDLARIWLMFTLAIVLIHC